LVDRLCGGVCVGVVERDIEGGAAEERGEVGQVIADGEAGVEGASESGEHLLLEVMAYFHCVARGVKGCPCSGKLDAEILEGLMSGLVGQFAWPDPLNAEGCFAPAMCGVSELVDDGDFCASAGDGGEGFVAELEGDASVDGEEVEFGVDDSDIGGAEVCHGDGSLIGE